MVLLLAPGIVHAEDYNTALLAISFDDGRVTAGMMCNSTGLGNADPAGVPPVCRKFEEPGARACQRSSSSILNPDILAFDVTRWPRHAVAELANRLQLMDDPLNYDFSRVTLAGWKVRRIMENRGQDGLAPLVFEFSSGSYLLMKAPGPSSASGS
ncbi:hypothetical protein [Taklimakanibacter lacteus]|uniref:hypothetical protein n=1 Tax=Taklimakanibacter lacteus TaxID=2268456 RepID=UPI0013C52AF9